MFIVYAGKWKIQKIEVPNHKGQALGKKKKKTTNPVILNNNTVRREKKDVGDAFSFHEELAS